MPRVDEGMYVVELADILRIDEGRLHDLASWALSVGALFVTSPSIVPIKTQAGAVRISVGIGSLISRVEPPVRHYVIASPEWVDACITGQEEPAFQVARGQPREVRGVAVALDTSLPVAMMLNSMLVEGEFVEPAEGHPALVVEGEGTRATALAVTKDGLTLGAIGGTAASLLRYGLTLYTSCRRAPS